MCLRQLKHSLTTSSWSIFRSEFAALHTGSLYYKQNRFHICLTRYSDRDLAFNMLILACIIKLQRSSSVSMGTQQRTDCIDRAQAAVLLCETLSRNDLGPLLGWCMFGMLCTYQTLCSLLPIHDIRVANIISSLGMLSSSCAGLPSKKLLGIALND